MDPFDYTLLYIDSCLFLFILLGMLAAVPRRMWLMAKRNCYRVNGTYAPKLARQERKHFLDLIVGVSLAPFTLLLSLHLIVILLHTSLIPIPLALDMLSLFDVDAAQWEGRMEAPGIDYGRVHSTWFTDNGGTVDQARFWQQILWNGWPLFLIVGAGLLIVSWHLLSIYFIRTVSEYEKGIIERRRAYLIGTIGRNI